MSSFKEVINDLKTKYFLYEEFPLVDRADFPENSLDNAMKISDNDLENYTVHLKNKDIEGLLLDLVDAESVNEINRAVKIIALRSTKRILKLISYLSQYNYDSVGINILCANMSKIKELSDSNAYIKRFGMESDKVLALVKVISVEGQNMDAILKKYNILPESKLAMDSCLEYFKGCDKNAFLINNQMMLRLINEFPAEKASEMLINYFDKLSLVEYLDEINLAVLYKFGQPTDSDNWHSFPQDIQDKFTYWCHLYRLKIHCKGQKIKFNVLVKYFEYVKTNYTIDELNTLITDFGDVVLADVEDDINIYLYDKYAFKREMTEWEFNKEILPTFITGGKNAISARDFMLSVDDPQCIKLTFDDIDYYYIDEILEIKLGLEPDMRSDSIK